MSELSKQAGLLTAADFLRFFIKTLIGIALARILTPADYGSYRQLFLIYTTFSTILLLGIPQSMMYFLPKAGGVAEQKKIVTRTMNVISILALAFTILILLTKAEFARRFNNPALNSLLIIYCVYPLFMFITQIYSTIMLGLKEPAQAARFTLFAIAADFVLVLGVAVFTKDLHFIAAAVVVSAFLQWVYAQTKLRRYNEGWHSGSLKGFGSQLAYCVPLGLSSVVGMLSIQLDKLMISGFFTPEQFAIFSVGAMELPLIGILANSVNAILLPNLSAATPKQLYDTYSGSVRKNALLVFPMTAIFYILAQEIMVFLYGATYAEAALYFRIYLVILPLRIATYSILFQALGKTRIIMINSAIVLCLNFVLNYILIKALGMKGAAIATVIVTWISVIIYLAQMKVVLKLRLQKLFPLIKIAKTALSAVLAAIPCLILQHRISQPVLRMILVGSLFSATYLLFSRISGALLPYDVSLGLDFLKDIKKRMGI